MKTSIIGVGVTALWALGVWIRLSGADASSASAARAQLQAASRVDFARQVAPILERKCLECHSQEKRRGGLSLASYDDVLDGGKNGAIILPGDGANSLLIRRLVGDIEPQMPKDEDPLTRAEIGTIRQWVEQGARQTPQSAAAPQPWVPPLELTRPAVPPATWPGWSAPLDRFTSSYLAKNAPASRRASAPPFVSDAAYARRVYLDLWGLLPEPEALQAFVADTAADKRERLVATLLADNEKYAEHWISFWNDLLRNEDGVTYFSDAEGGGRQNITEWLLTSLRTNIPYNQFVAKLLNPAATGDPAGFLIGVNWRGETSAAVKPWMQASQNTAQVFLGVNMKCNACHDSFISRWKLKDAYALAAYFSPEPRLQLYRCDVARDEFAEPGFLFPELSRAPASPSLADRRAAVAAIFTDPRNGRMPRTVVNRIWERLLGHGIVPISDEMDGKPWSPELLDWIAGDFVDHGYDLRRLIASLVTSRTYQMNAVRRTADVPARNYVFQGPEVRRLSAEQFADAVGFITGEWRVGPGGRGGGGGGQGRGAGPQTATDATSAGTYAREWRLASSTLTRALGRPVRDQVTSVRARESTTPQALELVNGEILTSWLLRGARRMVGELPADPISLFNGSVAGRNASARAFDVDVSRANRLWLLVRDTGSNAPERVKPAWHNAEFVAADGSATPLSMVTPIESTGSRAGASDPAFVRVTGTSQFVYDIAGRGFTRLRGELTLENDRLEIGSTLNPSIRFFVFDARPNMDRLVPPIPGTPLPAGPVTTSPGAVVDRLFWHALQRAPTAMERRTALAAVADPARPDRVMPEAVADLLWAVLMKPEFQLIF